jgi:ATP-binding cassette subfamily B protein
MKKMDSIAQKKKKEKKGIARLVQIAGTKRKWLISAVIFSTVATLMNFIPLFCIYLILVELAENATSLSNLDIEYLYMLAFISLGSFVLYGLLMYVAMICSHIAAFRILYEIRVKLAEKLPKLSMGYFTEKASGEIKKVMSEDVERIELFIAHHIPDITSAIIFPFVLIGYLFIVNWILAIVSLIPIVFGIMFLNHMMRNTAQADLYREYHNSLEKMNASVVEYVKGMPVVKVFNGTAESFEQLEQSIYSYRDFCLKITKDYLRIYPAFLTVMSSSLIFILPAIAVLFLTVNVYEDFVPIAILFLIVGGGMYFSFMKLMYVGSYLRRIRVGTERVDEILFKSEVEEVETELTPNDSSIEFLNVSFAYNHANVLEDISFTAEPGTITALVGPSGAGKTTIGLLTARFWDIQEGEIQIGGVNIKDMKVGTLMDYVSFVFQEGFLFYDTIEENIRMGNTTASKNDVINAAQAAQCHEFIEALPEGYNTLIGEGGTYLSGGEKQRITIARMILKNTPIVVLDEATAYADPEGEGLILDGLAQLIKEKTVLIIAHRLSTIIDSDNILVIDDGHIVQQGTHNALVKTEGLYKNMFEIYSQAREWKIGQK